MVPYLEEAAKLRGDSEDFLKVCLRLQEMPYLVLASTLSESRPLSEGRSSLSSQLRRVESLALQDRLREAGKVLCSNGVAAGSEEGLERIRALHPALKEAVPPLHTDVSQFSISAAQARRALFGKCGEAWVSLDPFGWSTALLHLVRAAEGVGVGQLFRAFFGLRGFRSGCVRALGRFGLRVEQGSTGCQDRAGVEGPATQGEAH